MTLSYADQQRRLYETITKAHQGVFAQQQEAARHTPQAQQRKNVPTIDYQGCSQPWESAFAERLGKTEDFKEACKAAYCTEAMGERALRNPSVCTLAAESHKKACQELIDKLTLQLPVAQMIATRSEKTYLLTKSNRDFGQFYDDEKRMKTIKKMLIGLELRKSRPAFLFQNTKWQMEV